MAYNLHMNTLHAMTRARTIARIVVAAALTIGAIAMISSMSACTSEPSGKAQGKAAAGSEPATQTLVCIGDSITYGMGVADPVRDAWPALLQEKLGDSWNVVNLGVSGTTLLDEGMRPYRATGNVERALALDADMAIIMLGTNDSVDPAWNAEAYRAQLDALATELSGASTRGVRLAFMVPPHSFFGPGETPQRQVMNQLIGGEMRSIIADVAAAHDAQLVDLYAFTEGRRAWFPDDLHPNEAGNAAMAEHIYGQLF